MPRPVVRRLAATRRTRVLLAVAVALVLVTAGVAWALVGTARDDAGVSEQARTVRVGDEADGSRVSLDASVFTPSADAPGADADGRRAAVLLAHGFGGDKTDLVEQARDTAAEGYVVLTWTARGFGESGGLIHLDDPDYEVADASVLLDLLAARDDVRLDAEGDPRVGVAGASYGGALALLLAATDDRVDAIVPAITWNDLGEAFFPQDAQSLGGGETPAAGVFKQGWASRFVSTTVAQGEDDVREAAGAAPAVGRSAAGSPPTCAGSSPTPPRTDAPDRAGWSGCAGRRRTPCWGGSRPRPCWCRGRRTRSSGSTSPTPTHAASPRPAPRSPCAGSTGATTRAVPS